MGWRDEASCLGLPSDMFFVDRGASTRPAKLVCSECPVCSECLEFALEEKITMGIFGGLAWRDRRRILKDRGVEVGPGTRGYERVG